MWKLGFTWTTGLTRRFAMKKATNGYTLIEIMIVVMVVGILLAIAVPNFIRARGTTRLQAIVSNLRQIDTAVRQWGMTQDQITGAPVLQSNLDGTGGTVAYLVWPVGPVPGTYDVTILGANATFNGGALGAMDADTWRITCNTDP